MRIKHASEMVFVLLLATACGTRDWLTIHDVSAERGADDHVTVRAGLSCRWGGTSTSCSGSGLGPTVCLSAEWQRAASDASAVAPTTVSSGRSCAANTYGEKSGDALFAVVSPDPIPSGEPIDIAVDADAPDASDVTQVDETVRIPSP